MNTGKRHPALIAIDKIIEEKKNRKDIENQHLSTDVQNNPKRKQSLEPVFMDIMGNKSKGENKRKSLDISYYDTKNEKQSKKSKVKYHFISSSTTSGEENIPKYNRNKKIHEIKEPNFSIINSTKRNITELLEDEEFFSDTYLKKHNKTEKKRKQISYQDDEIIKNDIETGSKYYTSSGKEVEMITISNDNKAIVFDADSSVLIWYDKSELKLA